MHFPDFGVADQGYDCLRPNLLPNVKFAVDQNHTIETGTTVSLECSKGFQLKAGHLDQAEIHCSKGLWNGTIPTCHSKLFKHNFKVEPNPKDIHNFYIFYQGRHFALSLTVANILHGSILKMGVHFTIKCSTSVIMDTN